MYAIRTKHGNREVTAEKYNIGSDGFLHAKNGTTTVASIPRENVEGVFKR